MGTSKLGSYRVFGGVRYKLVAMSGRKKWADESAKKARAGGYTARVAKTGEEDWKWGVYTRKK